MPDLNTKQKILNASIRLFNENGLANVRLQQIANETGISVGNLAYHFRNKEAILDAVVENLDEEITEILATYRIFPNLIDFDHQLSKYFSFLQKYPFYFMDSLEIERVYPEICSRRRDQITKMISQIRKRFDFHYQRGVIKKEPVPGLYDSVAHATWIIITFWMPQHLIREKDTQIKAEPFKEMIFNQMYPYLTEKGIREYEALILPLLNQHSL